MNTPTLDYAGRPDPAAPRPTRYAFARFACFVLGVCYPLAGLAFNAKPGDGTVPVDWQNGQPWAWASLVTLPAVGWPQVPFLFFAWFCLSAAALYPDAAAESWARRLGLWVGVFMGLEFLLIVSVGMADGDPSRLGGPLSEQLGGLLVAGATVAAAAGVDWLLVAARAWPQHTVGWVIGGLIAAFAVAVLATGGKALGVLFVPVVGVYLAAPLSVGGFLAMLMLLYLPVFYDPRRRDRAADLRLSLLATLVLLPLHAFGWLFMWTAARRAYSALPTVRPEYCFVATAAARSRRSASTRHRQLRTLRAFESWLKARRPRTHAVVRRHYNATGPALARRIDTPRRADAAHRLLSPVERLARSVLRRT